MGDARTTSGAGTRRITTRPTARSWPLALALAGTLALCGCFELIRSARVSQLCTPEAARKAGDGDARSGASPRESYGQICGVAEPSLNGIYTEAYNAVPEAERAEPGFFRRLLH
jgi:hypothetical protein